MAIHHHHHHHHHHHNQTVSSLLDALYCDEEKLEEEEDVSSPQSDITTNNEEHVLDFTSLSPLLSLEQNLFSQDEELSTLFYKEKTQLQTYYEDLKKNVVDFVSLSQPRREAVQWMLKVNAHYAFSPLTATLAVTYFDRFLLTFLFQKDKPWMIQLVAVTCISLAAKVEESQVPFLLDLQVQDTKYVFEAKTIQRMELLILSTLKWKMHPVTPHSFLDHIITRLGLKTNLHWEFLRRCENLLLSVLLDSRFIGCVPSVLATVTTKLPSLFKQQLSLSLSSLLATQSASVSKNNHNSHDHFNCYKNMLQICFAGKVKGRRKGYCSDMLCTFPTPHIRQQHLRPIHNCSSHHRNMPTR